MYAASLLSFSSGFLSLSVELLWIRLFSYANHSFPQSFSFVLIWFLLGIGVGAHLGKPFCKSKYNLWHVAAGILIISAIPDALSPWAYAYFVASKSQLYIGAGFIFLSALLKAMIFPIAHHLGTSTRRVGRTLSKVYVANILGATIGPIFTGVFILAFLSTQQAFFVCASCSALIGIYYIPVKFKTVRVVTSVLVVAVFAISFLRDPHTLIAKVSEPISPIRFVKENQYGIITIYDGGNMGDIVSGGNVYDGRTNLDPAINSNGINRVLILSAIQERPTRVLMIGLSIGSWLKLVTTFPRIEKLDVLEVNPGYVQAMQYYAQQASALLDPRVHVYFNDARHWLQTHKKEQYDLIIMNTTYHWRVYAANLLSREFIKLVKEHMQEGGVLAYNATGSGDVFKTAVSLFKHAYLYENFVIAADFDWREKLKTESALMQLERLQMDGKPLFPTGSSKLISNFLNKRSFSFAEVEPFYEAVLNRKLEIVTDENLITEYKYGKRL